MLDFVIIRTVMEQMLVHAGSDAQREVCGLLGGKEDRATLAIAIPNVATTPTLRYEMDRQQMVEAILRLRREHMDVVGVYHSHPRDPATPSVTDIAEATWPDVVYVIIGRDADQWTMRGWSLQHRESVEVKLRSEDDTTP